MTGGPSSPGGDGIDRLSAPRIPWDVESIDVAVGEIGGDVGGMGSDSLICTGIVVDVGRVGTTGSGIVLEDDEIALEVDDGDAKGVGIGRVNSPEAILDGDVVVIDRWWN
jgi:hypothetical protein